MLIKKMMVLVCFSMLALNPGSYGQSTGLQKPFPYDLDHPEVINLPADLNEISGIVYSAKHNSLFAIEDENGILYQVFLSNPVKVKKWQFAGPGDYEDLAFINNTFYVLQSNGSITSFRLSSPSIATNKTKFPSKGQYEFESLYYDPSYKKLVMICKDCADDKKKTVSAWGFNPSTGKYSSSLFSIKTSTVAEELKDDKADFKPSAAAINPLTQDVYILSSASNALAVTSKDGHIKAVYPLNAQLFKQPEGIAFLPSGDMVISNEWQKKGSATLLVFRHK